MASSIDTVLEYIVDLIINDIEFDAGSDIDVESRVWAHPSQTEDMSDRTYPFVVVSKLNAEPGSWSHETYGAGKHKWFVVIAAYLTDGPIVVTNNDDATLEAMDNAGQWYEAMAKLFSENISLGGNVDFVGDDEGLYEYINDNIMWGGRQHFGFLFILPVTQSVILEYSS